MSASYSKIPRPWKADIALQILGNLKDRAQVGPPEPMLDGYIPELTDVADRLETHVQGQLTANAARDQRLAEVELADIDVDTLYRHIESYLRVEAERRTGPNVEPAGRLYKASCSKGLAYVDARVVDENAYCRDMLSVLREPEHEPTLDAIKFPMTWLDAFDIALTRSEAAVEAVLQARDEKSGHVELGRDAEKDFAELMIRLRKYLSLRARKHETAKRLESQALIRPLLDAFQKLEVDAATRATRREKAEGDATAPANWTV